MSECQHEFGEEYETQYKGIYGKTCTKCGFVLFNSRNKDKCAICGASPVNKSCEGGYCEPDE